MKSTIKKEIICPLMGTDRIDDIECSQIQDVVDGYVKPVIGPNRAYQQKNFREICKSCPNFGKYD